MTFKEFEEMFEGFTGDLFLYIEGSQGVSPSECKITYGEDFTNLEQVIEIFCTFIDENALENIEDYLEDCGYDEDEALMEAVNDSGNFYLGSSSDNLTHIYDGFISKRMEYEI